jgi:hypothetical protein
MTVKRHECRAPISILAWAGRLFILLGLLASAPVRAQAPLPTFTKITDSPVYEVGNGHGSAWVDIDDDGWPDLFDANYDVFTRHPCFLYRNNTNRTFTKITNGLLATRIAITATGTWGDYDNDGLPDLFLAANSSRNFLYHNDGNGTFTDVTNGVIVAGTNNNSWYAAWADYDRDGFLDLFVSATRGLNPQVGTNLLFHNRGDGTFTRVTSTALTAGPNLLNLACAWADYDLDGYPDLFVARTDANNLLFHNNQDGTFSRITNSPIALEGLKSFGCAWGDYDNDGYPDLFVTGDVRRNFLYRNKGDGTFTKITDGIPVNDGVLESLAAAWGDYDNDGFLDLFVANGKGMPSLNYLYHNKGDGTFAKITDVAPVQQLGIWHGGCWGDYDRDGFLDLFVTNWGESGQAGRENALYHNNGNTNAWLELRLRGTVSNRSAIGAKVHVKARFRSADRWQHREISGGDGVVQNSLFVHFGLGDATNIDLVRIEWPSGIVQELSNVAVRQFLNIREMPRLIPGNRAGEFQLMGGKGGHYGIEATTNLSDWERIAQLTNAQTVAPFADTNASAFPRRFYRALGMP